MREVMHPKGPLVKVRVYPEGEQKSAGGIITSAGTKDEDNETGTVVELGPLAYVNFESTGPWCKEGDVVLFQRYGGKAREEIMEDGTVGYFRILKDVNILATLERME